jgi:transposase
MIRMRKQILPDDVWARVEPLLPTRSEQWKTGRPPLPDRDALRGILFVLKTGISWQDLPRELGCGCGMTCLRRLREWQLTGIWDEIQAVLLRSLEESRRINWTRAQAYVGDTAVAKSSTRQPVGANSNDQY